MKMYKVMMRTKRTDWVEMNCFETKEEAIELVKAIQASDSNIEAYIEEC